MPTYVTATVKVKDPEKLQIYLSIAFTMAPFGGKPVCRGKAVKALHGSADFHIMATLSLLIRTRPKLGTTLMPIKPLYQTVTRRLTVRL